MKRVLGEVPDVTFKLGEDEPIAGRGRKPRATTTANLPRKMSKAERRLLRRAKPARTVKP